MKNEKNEQMKKMEKMKKKKMKKKKGRKKRWGRGVGVWGGGGSKLMASEYQPKTIR